MAKYFLSTYSVRIYNKKMRDYTNLDSLRYKGNLIDVLFSALSQYEKSIWFSGRNGSVLRTIKLCRANKVIAGIIEGGARGESSSIVDTINNTVSHTKQTFEADLIPFFFLIAIPPKETDGFLFLQRTSRHGIVDELSNLLRSSFSDKYGSVADLVIEPSVPEEAMSHLFRHGKIKRVRIHNFGRRDDVLNSASQFLGDRVQDGYITVTPVEGHFSRLRNRILNYLSEKQEGLTRIQQEFGDADFEIYVGGVRRIVNLSNLGRLSPDFDVTKEYEDIPNNKSHFEKYDSIARRYLSEYTSRLGISLDTQERLFPTEYDVVLDNTKSDPSHSSIHPPQTL